MKGVFQTGAEDLLERGWELSAIDDAIEQAAGGEGRVLTIEGEPGIGKTALLEALAGRASGAGMTVLSARARELERDFGFGVVRQLFEAEVHDRPADSAFAGQARFAAPVLGVELEQAPPAAPAAETVFPAIHGLYWMALNLAENGPLTLLVDDAHWADGASLRFLAYLAARIGEMPVLLAVAARPTEATDRLRNALGEPLRLEPGRLSEEATAAVVRSLAPEAGDEVCRSCHEATGGNAFYVREVAAAVRDAEPTGISPPLEAWSPESVTRTVAGRIAALAPGAREVARACAVLGDGAEPHAIAAIAGLASADAQAAVDSLRAIGILAPEPADRVRPPDRPHCGRGEHPAGAAGGLARDRRPA